MSKRVANERKFDHWEAKTDGGRRYWLDVAGRHGWMARYVKEVDASEQTLSFVQEIRDETGTMVEVHQKYPVDTGHQKI